MRLCWPEIRSCCCSGEEAANLANDGALISVQLPKRDFCFIQISSEFGSTFVWSSLLFVEMCIFAGVKLTDLDLFFSVGSGSGWKFSAVRGFGVRHGRDGWGGAASHWRPAVGWDKHQGILLCSWCSWEKHVGCPHCCTNHGIVAPGWD